MDLDFLIRSPRLLVFNELVIVAAVAAGIVVAWDENRRRQRRRIVLVLLAALVIPPIASETWAGLEEWRFERIATRTARPAGAITQRRDAPFDRWIMEHDPRSGFSVGF